MSFTIAFLAGLIATFSVMRITQRFSLVYTPTGERWNSRVVSLHGGIGIFIAFIVVLCAMKRLNFSWNEIAILGCGLPC